MTDQRLPAQWGDDIRPHQLLELLDTDRELAAGFHALGGALNATPDKRTLELIAVRVAAVRDNRYLWRGHAFLAVVRLGVLSHTEVARIAAGPSWLSARDEELVRAVEELLGGDLSSASKVALRSGALRFTVAVRFYDLVATLTRDRAPEPTTPIVPGLETPALAIRGIRSSHAA